MAQRHIVRTNTGGLMPPYVCLLETPAHWIMSAESVGKKRPPSPSSALRGSEGSPPGPLCSATPEPTSVETVEGRQEMGPHGKSRYIVGRFFAGLPCQDRGIKRILEIVSSLFCENYQKLWISLPLFFPPFLPPSLPLFFHS